VDSSNSLWWEYLHQNGDAWESFVRYIADAKSDIQDRYKKAASWDEVQVLKGEEKRLDKLYSHATIAAKEEQQHKEYLAQTKQ
jgi:hypothetical protein